MSALQPPPPFQQPGLALSQTPNSADSTARAPDAADSTANGADSLGLAPDPNNALSSPSRTRGNGRGATQWHTRYRNDIRRVRERHAKEVQALAVKTKLKVASVRRFVDGGTKHFRSPNQWNSFQAWLKHQPRSTGLSRSSYRTLTTQKRQEIQTWQSDHRDSMPQKDIKKHFNAACREVTDRIRHLQLRFGIAMAAVVSHQEEGIGPFLAFSNESGIALGSALNTIKTGKTGDDLTNMFDRAVKLKVWTGGNHEEAMTAESSHTLPASQRLAKDLIAKVHAVVGPAFTAKGDDLEKKWVVATRSGTRLRYKDFFSLVAESGCYIDGWPKDAAMLLSSDTITDEGPTEFSASMKVWSGGLQNTGRWTEPAMAAIREALDAGTLSACVASRNEDERNDQ